MGEYINMPFDETLYEGVQDSAEYQTISDESGNNPNEHTSCVSETETDVDSSFEDKHLRGNTGSNSGNHYVKTLKSNMTNLLTVADLVLGNKTLSEEKAVPTAKKKGAKINYIDITVESSNMVARFNNNINYITMKIPIESKDMENEKIVFFKDDLKIHTQFCSDEEFIIKKVSTAYKTNLFDDYCYIQIGQISDEEKRENIFSDGHEVKSKTFVNESMISKILNPIIEVVGRKSKNEGTNTTHRVYFYNRHVFVFCSDKSFMMLPYPIGMEFPDCTLSAAFAAIFSKLLCHSQNNIININFHSTKWIKLMSDNFELSGSVYKNLDKTSEEGCKSIIESLKDSHFTPINKDLLTDVTTFSCLGRRLKKELEFNYDSVGNVIVKYTIIDEKIRDGYNHPVKISLTNYESCCPLKNPPKINSGTLKRLLRAFKDDDTLGILIRQEHVIIKNMTNYIVLYGLPEPLFVEDVTGEKIDINKLNKKERKELFQKIEKAEYRKQLLTEQSPQIIENKVAEVDDLKAKESIGDEYEPQLIESVAGEQADEQQLEMSGNKINNYDNLDVAETYGKQLIESDADAKPENAKPRAPFTLEQIKEWNKDLAKIEAKYKRRK